jgi:hypothetical protein
MISKEKAFKLIAIYFFISELYEKELKYICERHSNNAKPKFTDIEVLTIYIFVASEQHYSQIKEIYSFTKDFLGSRFPKMPAYQQFDKRLNNLSSAFEHLQRTLPTSFIPDDCDFDKSPVDSFPIVTCKGRNRTLAKNLANVPETSGHLQTFCKRPDGELTGSIFQPLNCFFPVWFRLGRLGNCYMLSIGFAARKELCYPESG